MPVLALKAFARRTALVLARFANRRAVRWRDRFDRRIVRRERRCARSSRFSTPRAWMKRLR